ncbi:hypothetical protein ASPZODRAFT_149721 [Penicilliopsis zonata CBS 506.65]|uniref:RTA1 domain protein n=1 Tax=Penicilliopsis zonata CBS 506.65 TaxID=1073090 RepID=A0A1L9STF2_9EURO|nr:hypothetical protein ASPZODRAFT_149721 [Penicilliopsis zonata CBS 506.65]OJJ50391.1 hypothetical protein ASPZODRAFT_149721 [Penicilliopsis zonata CBS 506.65]
MSSNSEATSLYPYTPSHVLPAIFSVLIGASLVLHLYQNYLYKLWGVTFWMFWGGAVFLTGWIARCVSSYHTANLNLYIVQTVFTLAGPPIYSAMAYNAIGRLLNYLPMHSPLNPNRVSFLFIYLGAAVEGLTGAGASTMATALPDISSFENGGKLVKAALILQATVEVWLVVLLWVVNRRCARAGMLPHNVRMLFVTLYGTSTLVLIRCVFRVVQSFAEISAVACSPSCSSPVLEHEWYLYVFEAAPMAVFTLWLNLLHPGKYLPREKRVYLDFDGKTERLGPGWIDNRSQWQTFMDPLDLEGTLKGKPAHEPYWQEAERWPVCENGSFAAGSASNVRGRAQKIHEVFFNMAISCYYV